MSFSSLATISTNTGSFRVVKSLYVASASELRQQVSVQQRRDVAAVADVRGSHRKPLPHRWRHGHVDTPDGISRRHGASRDRKRVPAESDPIPYQPGRPVRPSRQSLRVLRRFILFRQFLQQLLAILVSDLFCLCMVAYCFVKRFETKIGQAVLMIEHSNFCLQK